MMNKLLVMMIAAAAGCGVVTKPGPATGGSDDQGSATEPDDDAGTDDGGGSDAGSGSDMGSGSDTGSGSGSDSSHPDFPANTLIGSVQDERGDAIDFSTGEPVHTHAGTAVDLASGCPAVYKYAYLTDAQAPFGREHTANPLTYKVWSNAANVDPTASAYRVRTEAGVVALGWTSMTPDSEGVYHIEIRRDAAATMAALGTYVGHMYVDARFRDTGGNETIATACWDNHPLAAPLKIGAVAPGALFGMSLTANSTISPLLNLGSFTGSAVGLEVASLPVTQQTGEPIAVTIGAHPSGTGTSRTKDLYLTASESTAPVSCYDEDNGACAPMPGVAPVIHDQSGPLIGTWQLRILDAANNVVCRNTSSGSNVSCTIPPRAANAAPVAYRAVLTLSAEATLQPPTSWVNETTFAEWTVGPWSFTGTREPQAITGCGRVQTVVLHGVDTYRCTDTRSLVMSHVVDMARIDFNAIPFTLATGTGSASLAAPYVDATALTQAARTWDGGVEGIAEEL